MDHWIKIQLTIRYFSKIMLNRDYFIIISGKHGQLDGGINNKSKLMVTQVTGAPYDSEASHPITPGRLKLTPPSLIKARQD
jgi:hypothetical protein